MTNKYILATVMLLAAGYVSAQNKLSPTAITLLEEYNEAPASRGEAPEVCAIVSLHSPDDLAEFETLGLEIEDDKDGILLVHIPMDRVEEVAAMKCVKSISFGQLARPMMDKARVTSKVSAVQAGEGLSKAYTGAGVVTGLYDTGIDTDHINFTDASGETRIIAAARVQNGRPSSGGFTTDNKNETHGTHVLGIMAGSYNGNGDYAGTNGNVPYYGVATGSDIVATAGELYDANILRGVQYCIDEANEVGKPVVVNLSIGSTVGPHDGTSDFCQKLDKHGENAIIVVAAGNEGAIKMGVGKTFTSTDKTLTTSVYPIDARTGNKINNISKWSGNAQFYASDDRPFKFHIAVMDLDKPSDPQVIDEYVVEASTAGKSTYVGGRPNNLVSYQPLQDFDYACSSDSYMQVFTNVNTASNSYYANVNFNLSMARENDGCVVAFIIEGNEGQTVRGYVNSSGSSTTTYTGQFSNRGVSLWADGDTNGTINDMACGDNVIVVGSYNSRNRWPSITSSRETGFAGYTVGDVSDFSSYGTLADGRNLPHICAPGAFVVSSFSSYYVESQNPSSTDLVAKVYDDALGIDHYWGRMQGTSMAAPYAAGVFALWLEANPNLDVNAIRDIAQKTAIKDSYTSRGDAVKWGAGKLDAYEGLKMALSYQSSVDDVLAEKVIIYNEVAKGVYDIFAQGASTVSASLYALNGTQAAAATAVGENVTLNAHGLTAGVYILRINADGNTETHKVVVK